MAGGARRLAQWGGRALVAGSTSHARARRAGGGLAVPPRGPTAPPSCVAAIVFGQSIGYAGPHGFLALEPRRDRPAAGAAGGCAVCAAGMGERRRVHHAAGGRQRARRARRRVERRAAGAGVHTPGLVCAAGDRRWRDTRVLPHAHGARGRALVRVRRRADAARTLGTRMLRGRPARRLALLRGLRHLGPGEPPHAPPVAARGPRSTSPTPSGRPPRAVGGAPAPHAPGRCAADGTSARPRAVARGSSGRAAPSRTRHTGRPAASAGVVCVGADLLWDTHREHGAGQARRRAPSATRGPSGSTTSERWCGTPRRWSWSRRPRRRRCGRSHGSTPSRPGR